MQIKIVKKCHCTLHEGLFNLLFKIIGEMLKLRIITNSDGKKMKIFSLRQISEVLNCPYPKNDKIIQGFSVDTRHLQPNQIFAALKGERVDGHSYLAEAKKKGASAALVKINYEGADHGMELLRVPDPLSALQELAKASLARTSSRIVAVTGSVGKTTTKEFIKTLLSLRYAVAASVGNLNSQAGLPLTLLNNTEGNEEILILEMGMSEPGELTRLVQMAPPEVSVLTTAALVHACNFNSIEEIALTKGEIFLHPKTQLGLLHRDISNYSEVASMGSCPKLSFSSFSNEADYQLDYQAKKIYSSLEKKNFDIKGFAIPGKHNLQNFLAAAAVGRYFKLSWEEMIEAVPRLLLPQKRLQLAEKNGITFLNDSYNASEISVKAALECLPLPKGKGCKVAVLGSMMELGKFSESCHASVGDFALNHVEKMFCLGEECQPIYDRWKEAGKTAELFTDRGALVACLRKALKPSDVVLLKGSLSKQLWKVLEEL
ncbi:MAG: UDP-N-acetylmuramoyl-tripeptide--D-alanyl-D-alanine ligase [Candidatus Protochlamydia sp.]|nr:UDP-N-acetylmuramoyl-tripeptide--D-alanyl-D-alanine ligase [Candidatus Protochlamydia sp.]